MAVFKITDLDAWSDGQMRSKMWMIDILEQYIKGEFVMPTIWQLAGWYAIPAFLLHIRQNVSINKYRSFDTDPACEVISEAINNTWLLKEWKFKSTTLDINELDYSAPWHYHSPDPDIIINTSCEHMETTQWFDNIPSGKFVVLQSTDMKHSDHHSRVESVTELKQQLKLSDYFFADELEIKYSEWSFKRFITIGVK